MGRFRPFSQIGRLVTGLWIATSLSACLDTFRPQDYRPTTRLQGIWAVQQMHPTPLVLDRDSIYPLTHLVFCPQDSIFFLVFQNPGAAGGLDHISVQGSYHPDSVDATLASPIFLDLEPVNTWPLSDAIRQLAVSQMRIEELQRDLDRAPHQGNLKIRFGTQFVIEAQVQPLKIQEVSCRKR